MSIRLSGGAFALALALPMCLSAAPAQADMRVCNSTKGRVGLAIGYLDGPVWVTEGWFNLKPNRCEFTPIAPPQPGDFETRG